ncbi:MAG: hypothetical protein WCT04_12815 [Planctomycetota bacterium]
MRFHAAMVAMFILVCTCGTAAEQRLEFQIYDVTDLTSTPVDFPFLEQARITGDNICCYGMPTIVAPTCASIAEMIKIRVQPKSWDPVDGASIEEKGGMLVVMQTAEVHKSIAALFATFREQIQMQVVVKGLLVPSATIPRETYFNAEALGKLIGPNGVASVLAAPRIVCRNGQRTHVRSTRDFGHIHDFEVSGNSLDPVIRQLKEGCIFDVRPRLSHDRRSTTVELRCTLTSGAEMKENRRMTLAPPMANAGNAAVSSTLEVDTSSMKQGCVKTTVRIPNGVWMLAGTIQNPDVNAKEKNILVLVSAEALNKETVGKPAKLEEIVGKINPSEPAPKTVSPKAEKDSGPLELRIFDIRDMASTITDFPAPNDAGEHGIDPFATQPISTGLMDTDIATLIREKALVDYFADPECTIDVSAGKLVVVQHPAIHEKIAALLDEWRQQLMPQMITRAHLVAAAEIPDASYFDEDGINAILTKAGNESVADFRCLCLNKQITHARNGREFSYVMDYDVSGEVYDPVIKNAFEGSTLEVHPIRSSDRQSVLLNVGFSLSSDVARTTRTLGIAAGAGATSKATITNTSSETSHKKYNVTPPAANAPPKTDQEIAEESKSSSSHTSAGLMNGQFIAGVELDLLAMNTRVMNTQVLVPKNKWVLAAVFNNSNAKGPKNLLLFVTSETLVKPDNK